MVWRKIHQLAEERDGPPCAPGGIDGAVEAPNCCCTVVASEGVVLGAIVGDGENVLGPQRLVQRSENLEL